MSLFPETLQTERLTLERISRENVDIDRFYRICSGQASEDIERVTEYLTWSPHETPKETEDFVAHCEQGWEDGESAQYLVRPREDEDGAGEIAGATGLTFDWDRRTATLGIWLRKPFWGRGYSGERADALIDLAFDRLDLELVAVTHQVENEPSRRAIEKYIERNGGQFDALRRNWETRDDEPVDVRRYSVSRSEWRDAR